MILHRLGRVQTLVLALCFAAVLSQLASAQAAPRSHHKPKHLLAYLQGTVMSRSETYAVFWLPPGSHFEPGGQDARYEDLIERYFRDVGGTSFYNILTQYSRDNHGRVVYDGPIRNSSRLVAAYVDSRKYPHPGSRKSPLTLDDILHELERDMAREHWAAGDDRMFFMFTAGGAEICDSSDEESCTFPAQYSDSTWCGLHESYPNGRVILYAVIPDVANTGCDPIPPNSIVSPNHDPYADSSLTVVSHEQFETVTDPVLNGWTATINVQSEEPYPEIADLCVGHFGAVAPDGSNLHLHGHPYLLQEEWSNADGRCVLSYRAR